MIMISSASFCNMPFERVFELVERNFEGWEITAEGTLYLPGIEKKLAEALESRPLEIQVHAPLSDINIAGGNPFMRESALNEIIKAIESAGRLGVKIMTIHPGFKTPLLRDPPRVREETKKSLEILEKHALDNGIILALENMPDTFITVGKRPEDIVEMTEGLEIKWCFDAGHANTTGTMEAFLEHRRMFGNVHLHDNDGKADLHLPLGEGTIDWDRLLNALGGYGGNLVLEMDRGIDDGIRSLQFMKNGKYPEM